MTIKCLLTVCLLSFFVVQPDRASSIQDYYPTEEWMSSTPEEQGMDSEVLAGMYEYIRENNLDIDSVVVIKNGYIVEEVYLDLVYDQNTPHQIYSCTKSISSALIGIAINEGYLTGVDQHVLDFFPERKIANLDSQKQALTIEHYLTMTTGLDWKEWPSIVSYSDPANTFNSWRMSKDWVQFVLDREVVKEPGTVFNYNTGTSHLLSAIVQQATGEKTLEFAQKHLFGPLGITNLNWRTDPQGIYTGGSGLALTPRDMAKFGYLYLKKGMWDGDQIVSNEWVEVSTKAQISASSHISGCHYGYQWWIYPDLGAYAALGWAGQQIFVIPDHELVVVFTGYVLNFPSHYVKLIGDFIITAAKSGVSDSYRGISILNMLVISGVLIIIIWRWKMFKNKQ